MGGRNKKNEDRRQTRTGKTATIGYTFVCIPPVQTDDLTLPVRGQLGMFKSFFKKIDSTVRERLGNDPPRDVSVKKPTSKKDTSVIKVASLVKANDTLKNMSTTLKSSFSRRKAGKDEIGREFVEARMVQFEKACEQ